MEACPGAHHIGRQSEALGHDVRLFRRGTSSPSSRSRATIGMRRHGALLTVGRPGALRRCELVGLDAVSPADGTGFVAVDERGTHGPHRRRHRANAHAPARASPRQDPQGRQGGRGPIQRPLAARPQHDQAAANELPSYRIQIHTRTNRRIWCRAISATATGGKAWVEGVGF